jgi:uncharacterized repeat protein (TIGR01451 family)
MLIPYAPSDNKYYYSSLTISKSATTNNPNDPTTYNAVGQTITYTCTVTNSGDQDLPILPTAQVTVTDFSGQLPCNTDLAPGQSVSVTSPPYTITQGDIDTGFVKNYASGYYGTGIFANNIALITAATPTKATPILTWNQIGSVPYGTPLTIPTATDQNNNPIAGTFTYVDQNNNPITEGQVLPVGTYTITATFTPTDTTDYTSGGTVTNSITVTPANNPKTPIIK